MQLMLVVTYNASNVVGRELARDGGGEMHGLCGSKCCTKSKTQTPNKSDVETKDKREMKNKNEGRTKLFGWRRCGGASLLHD